MNKRLRLPLALSLAFGSTSAFALGLGQIEVKSGLNQPLSAEIPVISGLAGETDGMVVRLAPPEALQRVGLEAPTGMAANLEFAVETRGDGQKVIRVTTPGKLNDPFVSFLLEVDWGGGKMLREYTVLLDPPTMAPVRSAPASAPVVEAPAVTEALPEAPPPPPMTETPADAPVVAEAPVESTAPPEPQAEPAPEPEPVAETPAPAPMPEPARERVDTYGPVASGETLWSIAQYARPDESVSMNQMMLALLYANPDAFIDQNINRLKKGAVLRIPGREEAIATAAAEAAAQVSQQMQAWRQTSAPVEQPAEPEPDPAPAAPVASTPARTDSRLELVPPRDGEGASGAQSGASVAGEGRELRAELARTREESASLAKENVELKSRVGELEKIQRDSERLIELKDSELKAAQEALAELQARQAAADAAPAAVDAAPTASPPTADAAAPVEATATDPAATDPGATPATDTAATGTDPSVPVDGSATPAEPDAPMVTSSDTTARSEPEPPATAEPMPARPAPSPWYMNPFLLGGGGLVVVGLLALLLGRRRAKPAPAATSSASAARYAGAVPSAVAAAPAVRESAKAVEPDRGTQLAEAVARDPGNLNRHLELVRYHYDAGDAASFEQSAEAMYSRVYDPENMAWKQVVAMGHEIAPEHPLFLPPEPPAMPVATPAPQPIASAAAVAAAAPAAREIDWGRSAPAADAGSTQQMRIDDVQAARSTPPARAPEPEPEPEPAFEPTFESVPEFDPAQGFDPDLSDSFSPPAPAPASDDGFVDADAASTKLELARAYLDMGDVEGARGMLEEVASEGNPGQRAEAKRLLDEIR